VRIAIAVCLLLSGCRGSSERIRVRIADIGPGLQMVNFPVSFAEALGYYNEEGLDVTLEKFQSSARTMQALIGGSADAASMGYSLTIQVAAQGQHVRSFFVAGRRASNVLVVAPAASKRIRRVEDLKGRVVGVSAPGAPVHLWTNYYLAAHGIGSSDISFVGIGIGQSAIASLESGRIDAGSLSGGDHILFIRRNPSARILVDGTSPEVMRETFGGDLYANGIFAAKQEWLGRNPDTARRLGRALVRTQKWILTHTPEEIRERLPDSLRTRDASLDTEIIRWGRASYTTDGRMPNGAPEAMKRFLDATVDNVRDSRIDLAGTWTNEFLPEAK